MTKLIENQQLVSEWDWNKNKEIDINTISGGSEIKVWWKCNKGHEWQAMVGNRFRLNSGCPYCAGLIPIKGENDLETLFPTLAEEWHPTKNGNLRPSDVLIKSRRKVWWQCKYGHEWQAVIYSRTAGTGCPICKKTLKTSEPEQIMFYYISNYFPDAINTYRSPLLENRELDVFIPSINVGVEYDGTRYHKDVNRDYYKEKLCMDHGITLYRIREPNCPILTETVSKVFILENRSKDEFLKALLWLLSSLGIDSPDIDIERDLSAIRENLSYLEEKNSLAMKHPELIIEWCSEKNGTLTPSNVSSKSHKKVWWKCKNCGHEWIAPVSSRSNGFGCPKCGVEKMVNVRNQRYINKHGSLLEANPAFLSEWDYEHNINISPDQVSISSNRKVWWKCNVCGHEWQATVWARNSGSGCPKCSKKESGARQRKRFVLKDGSLLQTHPEIATEWHPTKNGDITPETVSAGSHLKVWWKCEKGHEWQTDVLGRVKSHGCPFCSNRRVLSGFNDLETRFPEVAKEWAMDKNNGVSPSDVMPHTNKKYWWRCSKCGHEWETSPNHRCSGQGCPVCAMKKMKQG